MGRLLGVDYGDRRVGFALSDPLGILATAKDVQRVEAPEHAANETARRAHEWGAEGIIVGLPLNMDGSRGEAVTKVDHFIELLRERTELPVKTWDERLTTHSAHAALRAGGTDARGRKNVVDKVAAEILLQAYIDAHPAP